MNIEYSTSTAILISLGTVVLTIALIAFMRRYFANKDLQKISESNNGSKKSFSVATRNKYPEVDVFAFRNSFFGYGLAVAMGLMIVAFSWTTRETVIDTDALLADFADEIEMETPRTMEPPPPPPPPPPTPTALQIVETDVDIETIEFEDMSISEDTELEGAVAPPKREVAPPPPPPPPPPAPESKEISRIVEEQPTFKGCESIGDKAERQKCAEVKLMEFIYDEIQYPSTARENNIQGTVVVQFVVETDGRVSNVKIVRNIGGGCGQEAARVIEKMPAWNPGKQRGRAVRVMFTLPVKFKLA